MSVCHESFNPPVDVPRAARALRMQRGRVARRLFAVMLVVLTVTAGRYEHVVSAAGLRLGGSSGSSAVADTDHLDPALHRQLDLAISAAAAAGVELRVTSGYRSPAEQQKLYDAAIRKYGSPEAASHWVLPPDQSAHVRGQAVDVGPRAGARWLERHGAKFGLCRRYDNEWWHFELLAPADGGVCPTREPHAGS
jgi:zinc D-Ala-D-Ala carboxypeptidase